MSEEGLNVTGDSELARTMREIGVKAPMERIIRTDIMLTIHNEERLGKDWPLKRVVDLECGHRAVTKNKNRVACLACREMILNGEDYDAFRNSPGGR